MKHCVIYVKIHKKRLHDMPESILLTPDSYKDKDSKGNPKIKAILLSCVVILIPYLLFILSLFFLFMIHSGIMMAYIAPDGFVVLAFFSMMALIVGSTIMSPLELTANVIADVQTSSGAYEIAEYGSGNYSVGERGNAGIGIIILKFLVNIIISPFMILYWMLVFILILTVKGYAQRYIDSILDKKMFIASGVMCFGFLLASIELGCVNANSKEYSPDRFVFQTTELSKYSTHYYRDDFVADDYEFNIKIFHPHINELKEIEITDVKLMYNGQLVNELTLSARALRFYTERYDDMSIRCYLSNVYLEAGHDGYGYLGLDNYNFDGYIKLSEIDVSKLEIHILLYTVSFGNHNYSYIRSANWKDIIVNNNFQNP